MTDMSSASSKGGGDLVSAPPTFSYAQAAKGIPATSVSAPVSKPGSVSSATSNDLTSLAAATPAIAANSASSAVSSVSSAEALSSSSISQPEEAPNNIGSGPSDPHPKFTSPSPRQQLPPQSLSNISTPSSPDFGTPSPSTNQKEDDVSSTPNTSSESTWDKQSQSSTTADKAAGQAERDKGKEKEKERDISRPLVAAAIPIVNIWQQRKEAQAAKAKLNPQVSASTLQSQPKPPAPSAVSNVSGPSSHIGKTGDGRNPDQGKLDAKRRGKFAGEPMGDDDKIAFGQAGERKDTMGLGRDKRKSFDVHGKLREDTPRKAGSRVKASPDKGRDPPSIPVPPPAEDPISWPTPETAQDEKKRAQEKVEKPEKEKAPATGTRPHGKEKWMPVPYTPTVVYQTPLPGLRGRGGRSARGGRASINTGNGVGNGVDKGASQPLTTVATDASERGRTESTTRQDPASLPFRTNKRPASIGPGGSNSQRKAGHSSVPDKHREADIGTGMEAEAGPPLASPISRRTSTATQTDHTHKIRQDYRQGHRGDSSTFNGHAHTMADRNERVHAHNSDGHTHPRSAGPDRRTDSFGRGSEYFRDNGTYPATRERGEGGTERIRGGYRGSRGNSNGYANGQHSNHGYANGHQSHHQNSATYPYPKSPSPYQGPQPQAQQSGQYSHSQQQSRNYRNGPRSQSVPTPIIYNGYSQGVVGGPQQLSAIQTSISNLYDYPGVPLGAVPYSPYLQQYSDFIKALVEQLEYYFSIENLCKDLYLRKQMDSQGFVFFKVIGAFNRIRSLTQDMDLVRYACLQSPELELAVGPDGVERLRKRNGWQHWVLALEDRHASAQNDGPSELHRPKLPLPQQPGVDAQYMVQFGQPSASPIEMVSGVEPIVSNPATNSPLSGVAPSFTPSDDQHRYETANGEPHVSATPLSAAVPDFSPSVPPVGGETPLSPGKGGDNVFTDEQVESLVIVVRKQGNTKPGEPYHSASRRTFSNGSIDVRTIADELDKHEERQSRPLTTYNSEIAESETSQRSKSPSGPNSSRKTTYANPSPVFWVKDRETPIDSLPSDLTHESYNTFRKNALKQREMSAPGKCHRDMDVLYQFWSHFLIRNFNSRMFDEFRKLAYEDVTERQSTVGTKNLIQYYDEALASKNTISQDIARHYVELVKLEDRAKERPGFEKLRAAWRNGALNMKNRKKIDTVIDPELRAELEH